MQINQELNDTYDLTVFFTILGSTSVKSVHKALMKLTPDFFLFKKLLRFTQFIYLGKNWIGSDRIFFKVFILELPVMEIQI